jgi:nucleoside-diphosphate-sugar epimerase
MKVLITGHKGYVGTVMVPMFLEAGHTVTGLDSNLYSGSTFGQEDPRGRIAEMNKDVRDIRKEELRGFDAVVHLAGLSNDPLGDLNPDLTYEINFQASLRLAELAKEAGVRRYVFSSSCSNYGAGLQNWLDENSPFNPVTPYGQSKVLTEQEVSLLADDDFSPVFMRSATAYGVSSRLRFDLVLNNLVAWAYTTGLVYLKSDGSPWRPLVHIEDMSRAFLAAVEAPREAVHNQAFNVGRTDENFRIREIAEIVVETVPASRVEFAEGAGPDIRNYRVNCDKIRQQLPGFVPQWTVRKGAQQLYQTYQEIGLQKKDFEGPRYRRIDHIKHLIQTGRLDSALRWREPEIV